MTRYVIGDIHGCGKALRSLIEAIAPAPNDELICLGDYVDRGPNTKDVIEQLLAVQQRCRLTPLRGNHEIMMLGVVMCGMDPELWLRGGGKSTIASYGGSIDRIPQRHVHFLQGLLPHHETQSEIFVHAMYDPDLSIDQQNDDLRYWTHLTHPLPAPHVSGKRVFVGHSPQASREVLSLPHLVCLDTYCFGGGYLTAMNLDDETVIQADRRGQIRRQPLERMIAAMAFCRRLIRRR